MLNKLTRKIAKQMLTFYIKATERTFGGGYKRIKYLLLKNKSDNLVVVFSGFPSEDKKASYNMVKTFWKIKMNKLFILDDFGYEKRGSYYLGENSEFFIPPMITELIAKVKVKENIKNVYCVGSSKGGYAALFYGLKCGADFIIAGAPQYLLGDYLSKNKKHLKILKSIIGDTSEKSIKVLNGLLRKEIVDYSGIHKPKVLIHYSKNEHTYGEHIFYLLNDLKEAEYKVEEDINTYFNHADVAKYFPNLCTNFFASSLR